jgi:hypothetical protein
MSRRLGSRWIRDIPVLLRMIQAHAVNERLSRTDIATVKVCVAGLIGRDDLKSLTSKRPGLT